MGLNSRGAMDPRLGITLERPLSAFNNCAIEVYDMKMSDETGADWDWKTDTGGSSATPVKVFSTEGAQMQVFRFTLTMDGPVGSVDQYRTVRFTFDHRESPELRFQKGWVVRVTSCPGNPANESYQYIINSGLNSGSPFRRTIETEVDMARVWPE